jgi:hypothetical protein
MTMKKGELDLLRRQVEELKTENVMLQQKLMASRLHTPSDSESEELLNATQRLSKVGGWEWNVEKQTMFWTEETYRIHDFVQGELVPGSPELIEKSLACYDPADRPLIHNAFLNAPSAESLTTLNCRSPPPLAKIVGSDYGSTCVGQ